MVGQNELRGDGKKPLISIHAETLADAHRQAIIRCYKEGLRTETPKHKQVDSLGYDAHISVHVKNPQDSPHIYVPSGPLDDARGLMQYILEVTHGIHNHWKKSPEHPLRWGYTYNERFVDQIPSVLERIKHDWDEKKQKEGEGRITGREYQFDIWRAGEDIILEQEDSPCWQRGLLSFAQNNKGEWLLNYSTSWRSRDLSKAWIENNLAQIQLQKLFAEKVSNMLGVGIKPGAYIDVSDSLHHYGFYFDRDNLGAQIESFKDKSVEDWSISLEECLGEKKNEEGKYGEEARKNLKRLIAVQSKAEAKGHGTNLPKSRLEQLGYDVDNFKYPESWDTWDPRWDAEPDRTKLARVVE